jgi:protein-S-isoprenylcysteine O-methyltransferase Ste14
MPYPRQPAAERIFVWAGGAAFVGSLTYCAYAYAFRWGAAAEPAGWNGANVAWNAALLTAFAAHHSVFARPAVKDWMAAAVPPRLNRSVYVWIASLLLVAVVAGWRPAGGSVYRLEATPVVIMTLIQLTGMWLIARAVSAIAPLELAGIHPQRSSEALQVSGPYHLVRHPLYLGWMLIVFGPAHMTADRLTFAVLTSLYLVVAIPWEERALERAFGDQYASYRRAVRWRVIPFVY